MIYFKKIIERMKKVSLRVWILLAIVIVGIFLRAYNFRDWLYFYPDQARDLAIVNDYLTGKSSLPLLGFKAASTKFELGAMYYYFQIISGKIFGVFPQTMAYPDIFFNILSIPLFYYFFSKLFKKNISLVLTGLYAISFYAIEYSRFAWNPNPMTFFVLLFLLSLWRFLKEKEKVAWLWVVMIGASLGVGIQLHTILLYLFTVVSFACLAKLVFFDKAKIWRQVAVIFLIAFVLNINQLISETKHNFFNTRKLLELSAGASKSGEVSNNIALDAVCHAQANFHIISSFGNKLDCDFLDITTRYLKQRRIINTNNSEILYNPNKQVSSKTFIVIVISIVFSLLGYSASIYSYYKEKDKEKKLLWGLIIFYITFSFLVLFPVIADAPLRYYLQVFFVPYIFLGIIWQQIGNFNKKIFVATVFLMSGFLVFANTRTILAEAHKYASEQHSQARYVVLGELEKMTDYVQKNANGNSLIYMIGDDRCMQNYFKPFGYTFSERNLSLSRVSRRTDAILEKGALFYVGQDTVGKKTEINGFKVRDYQKFGEIGIYILENIGGKNDN